MAEPKDPFWIVVCDYKPAVCGAHVERAMRPADRPHRHTSEASAIREAIRLTRACRSQSFYVFKVVLGVKPPPDIVFENFVGEPDFDLEIPF